MSRAARYALGAALAAATAVSAAACSESTTVDAGAGVPIYGLPADLGTDAGPD